MYPDQATTVYFTFAWPCIVTNYFIIKPTRCINFTNIFWHETLHVSNSSSVHHQKFIHCTLYMSYKFVDRFRAGAHAPARKLSLARPTCILFDGENISFDASLVVYINTTNIPPIMIINRIYETQNLLSL